MKRKLSFVRFLYPTFTSYMMEFCLAGTLASVSFLWWKPFITLVCVAKERTALPLGRMWTNEREVEFVWQKLGANLRVHYSSPPTHFSIIMYTLPCWDRITQPKVYDNRLLYEASLYAHLLSLYRLHHYQQLATLSLKTRNCNALEI